MGQRKTSQDTIIDKSNEIKMEREMTRALYWTMKIVNFCEKSTFEK